jgi:hypothetical protein
MEYSIEGRKETDSWLTGTIRSTFQLARYQLIGLCNNLKNDFRRQGDEMRVRTWVSARGVLCTFVVEPDSNCECDVVFAKLIETVRVAQFIRIGRWITAKSSLVA